jgi:hypothetical protein
MPHRRWRRAHTGSRKPPLSEGYFCLTRKDWRLYRRGCAFLSGWLGALPAKPGMHLDSLFAGLAKSSKRTRLGSMSLRAVPSII